MASASGQSSGSYDHSFKILLIGDSGVGKTSLILSLVSNSVEPPRPTVGTDWMFKDLTVGGKKLKLTIWDTAGQDRFRTLSHSFYRDAHGIILVYDITDKRTFTSISDFWAKEVELYSTNQECVKMLVGNKVDKDSQRAVSREEGMELAKQLGCSFLECSVKTRENVDQCFETLSAKIMEVPSFVAKGTPQDKSPAPDGPGNKPVDLKPSGDRPSTSEPETCC